MGRFRRGQASQAPCEPESRGLLLDFGNLIFEGSPVEVHDSPVVRAAYLGELGAETAGGEA